MIKACHLFLALLAASSGAFAADNRIDIVRFDAPELAAFGRFDIGVRTIDISLSDRPDILNTEQGANTAIYDRGLRVEVWYPAALGPDQEPGESYTTATRNLSINATLKGRAVRDAKAAASPAKYPLLIISHGYPGNRYLMSHVGENLASKGYVVASIDHRDSTYHDQQAIASTLYNRPLDQLAVIDEIERRSASENDFLSGIVDTQSTGVIGYSMGGYGLAINLGGGLSESAVTSPFAPANQLAAVHAASNPEFAESRDPRIKAGFLIAPWGMEHDVWKADDLGGIRKPTFWLAGSADETAGYELGPRAMFEEAVNSDRYLLTYLNAGHSAGAPIPMPVEFDDSEDKQGANHYTDPVWDSVRMNNVMNHFVTAFFDLYLKGDASRQDYLSILPNAESGVFDLQDGVPTDAHTYWKGFPQYTGRGLMLEHLPAAQ